MTEDATTADRDLSADRLAHLVPLVYRELRRLARGYLARSGSRPPGTLQTTDLVHEAYLRLVRQEAVEWQNRAHILGIAARMMRRIIADAARKRRTARRGGTCVLVPLENADRVPASQELDVELLDQALTNLEALDRRQARIVELRLFGGLTVEETAELLGISPATVTRDWRVARAWLQRAILEGRPS
jgi:RNA polymerase sigma-70 factor, ECF subfamily